MQLAEPTYSSARALPKVEIPEFPMSFFCSPPPQPNCANSIQQQALAAVAAALRNAVPRIFTRVSTLGVHPTFATRACRTQLNAPSTEIWNPDSCVAFSGSKFSSHSRVLPGLNLATFSQGDFSTALYLCPPLPRLRSGRRVGTPAGSAGQVARSRVVPCLRSRGPRRLPWAASGYSFAFIPRFLDFPEVGIGDRSPDKPGSFPPRNGS